MSKSDIISKLMDEISSQNDWYLTAIGILITLTLFVSGFSIYAQLKLSDKQIAKLKASINESISETYDLGKLSKAYKAIDNLKTELSETKKALTDSEEARFKLQLSELNNDLEDLMFSNQEAIKRLNLASKIDQELMAFCANKFVNKIERAVSIFAIYQKIQGMTDKDLKKEMSKIIETHASDELMLATKLTTPPTKQSHNSL